MARPLAGTWGLVALIGLAAAGSPLEAQQTVALDKIRDYIHQMVTVEGKVAQVMRQRDDVWLSLGRAYPSGPLVIVIPSERLSAFPDIFAWRGRQVRVTGRVRPSALEAPPPPTRAPGDRTTTTRSPQKPHMVIDDPGMLTVIVNGQS